MYNGDELMDMLSLLTGMTGPGEQIAKDEVDGFIISTIKCRDMDEVYETAIVDEIGAHPVERYGHDKEAAIRGHNLWILKIIGGERTVLKLGYGSLVEDDEEITLKGG